MTLIPFVTPHTYNKAGLVWTTSDAFVATVSDGVVSGWKAGRTVITVTDQSGTVMAQCTVSVVVDSRPVTSVAVNNRTMSVNKGSTGRLSATVSPSTATMKGVTWRSSDENVARVNPNGTIEAVSAGTAVITAISDSGAHTASCAVTIVIAVESVRLPQTTVTLRVGRSHQLAPVITPAEASQRTPTYTVANSNIASVSNSGLITARRAGTTTITVSVGGQTARCTVVVTN